MCLCVCVCELLEVSNSNASFKLVINLITVQCDDYVGHEA